MIGYKRKSFEIIKSFKSLGFKTFTSFLNVCNFYRIKFNSLELSMWWRNDIQDLELLQKMNSTIEDILETIKYE